jgi:hypothetical protein
MMKTSPVEFPPEIDAEVLRQVCAENERLRAALIDVRDLAKGDAPNDMILDVCEDALAASN